MTKRIGFWLSALLVAVALLLTSCGASSGGGDGDDGGMQGMGQGSSDGGETSPQTPRVGTPGGGMAGMNNSGMDHGSTGSGGMARQMVMEKGIYTDRAFIDAMVPHHQGAVEMAEVALKNAEHEEIKQLSENIVSTQEAEIEELRSIKKAEYGTAEVPSSMDRQEMDTMGMTLPGELTRQRPFDKAIMDAMIPHHESAIEMADVALEESNNPRIQEIARAIVDAQQREIAQMRAWRKEWYPEG
jgi:uncharacterized protein (DUF305 family)